MNILVTGGTGFVGHWLWITQPSNLHVTYLNRWDYEHTFWDNAHWDAIIHAANVLPVRALTCCDRLLYISSGAIYDQYTEYSNNKRWWESVCLMCKINVVIARLFTFFGERLDENKAITQFVKAARAGTPIHIWGDGGTVRSYMYGKEMAEWLWAILLRGKNGEAYDVGSDKPITMLALAQMVNQHFGNYSQIIIENRQENCTYYMPRDTSKTKALL